VKHFTPTDETPTTGTISVTKAGTYYFTVSTATVTTTNVATTLKSTCGATHESATVTPAKPTLTTKATATVATEPGGKIKDTATISGGDHPTGTITFKVFSTSSCATEVGSGIVKHFTPTNETPTTGTISVTTAETYYFTVSTATVTTTNVATTLKSTCGAKTETTVTRVPSVQTLTPGYWKTHPGTLTNHKCVSVGLRLTSR
jgi:hypothetical protein